MTELTCPICGHNVDGYEGLVACTNDPDCPLGCAMYSLDAWEAMSERIERLIKANTRAHIPAPPSHDRMADVRLGAFTALCEERHVVRSAYVYQKEYEVDELEVRRDAARIAATVTLPDATSGEDRVREAALRVCDGWVGQHEIGELWHDEVKDMEALQAALLKQAKNGGK